MKIDNGVNEAASKELAEWRPEGDGVRHSRPSTCEILTTTRGRRRGH